MSTSMTSPKARHALAASAVVAYGVGLVALAVSGGMFWRMYCESFGCIGKGIAWFAWAAGFTAVLLLGYIARRTYRGAGSTLVKYGLVLQVAAGTALVVYWAAWRAA